MARTATIVQEKPQVPADKTVQAPARIDHSDVFVITNTGLDMLTGREGDEVRQAIENDKENSILDYRFFDNDKRTWAYWARRDVNGKLKPHTLPNQSDYSMTSPQLYTKAATYPRIFAHAVGLLREKPSTLWDKMLKPTTIIIAIVAIVFIMGLMMVALQG